MCINYNINIFLNISIPPRWWDQYNLLPWPDNIGIMVTGMFSVKRKDDRVRMMRRYIMVADFSLLEY